MGSLVQAQEREHDNKKVSKKASSFVIVIITMLITNSLLKSIDSLETEFALQMLN
jgi:hypothetical protein